MAITECCCLMLWGAHCDEAAAAIFVTTLRAAGLRVWLVGVSGGRIAGGHGLRIQPDLTPVQALPLAGRTVCVLIPCADPLLARFSNDPNVAALLTQTHRAQALFVVSSALAYRARQEPDQVYLKDAAVYPHGDGLFAFASTLAATLTSR